MVDFPKYDVRKTIDNQWLLEYEAGESIAVPAAGDLIVTLKEVPDDGTLESRPQIS